MTGAVRSPAGTLDFDSEEEAIEELHARGWTDGLPVVLPTPERVERALMYSPGLDPNVVLGLMGPREGEVTVGKVAVNAVMAGCRPEYLPVVLAAVEAVLDPVFHLGPMQETTHSVTPLIVVNGPVRRDLGIATGTGVLGPGHRANASIGRALRLVMINVGGGYVEVGDMAIFGSPAKFTMCVGEDEEISPLTQLHVSRGLAPQDSAVTVIPVEGPHTVVSLTDGNDIAGCAERLIASLGVGLAAVTSTSVYLGQGAVAVLLNPDHAIALRRAGLDREQILNRVWAAAAAPKATLRQFNPAMVRSEPGRDDEQLDHAVTSPDRIVLAVCGAPGSYSVTMPTWGAPVDLCLPITRRVREPQACEL